jgi:hypothetical protein
LDSKKKVKQAKRRKSCDKNPQKKIRFLGKSTTAVVVV